MHSPIETAADAFFKPVDLLIDSCFIYLFLQVKSRLYRSKFSNSAPSLLPLQQTKHLIKLLTCSLPTTLCDSNVLISLHFLPVFR